MPIITLSPPASLYRATWMPAKAGAVVRPQANVTAAGDAGRFVFATAERRLAEAYVFKSRAVSTGLWQIGGEQTAITILATRFGAPFGDALAEARQTAAFLQTVASPHFKAVVMAQHNKCPVEWVSERDVRVMAVEKLDGAMLMQQGLQVFTVNPDIVRRRLSLSARGLQERIHQAKNAPDLAQAMFIDPATKASLGFGPDAGALRALCRSGVLRWENGREEFIGAPVQPNRMRMLLDGYTVSEPRRSGRRVGTKRHNQGSTPSA